MPADTKFSQGGAHLAVKAVAVHTQVGGGIAKAEQAGLDLHRLSSYVDCSYLFPDMAQLFADGQAGVLIPSFLSLAEFSFGRPARMGRWPAGEFPVPLLGIGVAQAVHFLQSGIGGVALVDPELFDILPIPGD